MEPLALGTSFRTRELLLAAASVALLLALLFGVLELAVRWLDLPDPDFRYENQLDMWRPDPLLGFANRRHFRDFCFGDVRVATNGRGFRGTAPTPATPPPATTRIVGIGDSILWGTGVDAEDSLLGILAQRLEASSPHEVVNAAVVGYSSLQEQLQLERDVLSLEPDVVLVNYCRNDVLPTEDPFGNVREIYLRHLETLAANGAEPLPTAQQATRHRLERLLRSGQPVWPALQRLELQTPGLRAQVLEWFVETPVARMVEQARAAGVRLVFLFIPNRHNDAVYAQTAERLKKILAERGAEFVDLQAALAPDSGAPADGVREASRSPWWRPPQLDQISRWLHFQRLHARRKFIDAWHPSRRGNAIAAETVYRHLTGRAAPVEGR